MKFTTAIRVFYYLIHNPIPEDWNDGYTHRRGDSIEVTKAREERHDKKRADRLRWLDKLELIIKNNA